MEGFIAALDNPVPEALLDEARTIQASIFEQHHALKSSSFKAINDELSWLFVERMSFTGRAQEDAC